MHPTTHNAFHYNPLQRLGKIENPGYVTWGGRLREFT
jgi:hypothetical protein